MSIAMCCSLSQEDGLVVKYQGPKLKQFRESLFALTDKIQETMGSEMFFVQTDDCREDGTFSRYYRLKENTGNELVFTLHDSQLNPGIIINRKKDELYRLSTEIGAKWHIYNQREIAKFGNKAEALAEFGSLMPLSFLAGGQSTNQEINGFIASSKSTQWVVKPLRFNGGQGVKIVSSNALHDVLAESNTALVIQEFCETKEGIPGLVNGRHDLRVYVVDGDPVLFAVRTPKEGGYLANTSAGGSIDFYDITLLPKEAYEIIDTITSTMSAVTPNYFVSIDMFRTQNGWKLIEINDQPGLPARYQTPLADHLLSALVSSIKSVQAEA